MSRMGGQVQDYRVHDPRAEQAPYLGREEKCETDGWVLLMHEEWVYGPDVTQWNECVYVL